ncbi:hypothetical protein D0809_18890 [Flavobacterium circumlabens]|nr:hypothetical protein D0809_18890 [Flavobacterium circumlabens]
MLFVVSSVTAQKKTNLNIKPNLVLTYSAKDPKGNEVLLPLEIKELNDKKIVLEYSMINGDKKISGEWVISPKGLESGKYFNWQALNPSEVRILPKDQTIFCVSKKFLDEIKSKKTAKYDDKTFELKEIPKGKEIIVDGKEIDAIYIAEKGGDSKYWILNNRDLPFIVNSAGGDGPSFKLTKVSK